jgi:hypothetical protein
MTNKAAKAKVGGEAFFIKRNAKGNVEGDYIVAPGISIVCAAGTKKAGHPIKSQHFADGKMFDKFVGLKQIIPAPVEDKK